MDLANVPETVWQQLAQKAVEAGGKDVKATVDNYFYDHIYRRWTIDFQKIDYTSNMDGVKDVGWAELADMWAKGHKHILHAKDTSKGDTAMQTDDNDPTHKGTRLGEKYTDDATASRFQFLVSSGGGMVLLNRMRRACQQYIADKQATVVQWWKVFGESFADQGQSDACVVYLVLDYDDPEVIEFINKYLWPNIKDIVNDKFVPVGLVKVDNKPLWATWIPSRDKWSRVLGANTIETHYGSAGGLMGLVFGIAFANAVKTNPSFGKDALIPVAKQNARQLLAALA
jgi:hypothetical protein